MATKKSSTLKAKSTRRAAKPAPDAGDTLHGVALSIESASSDTLLFVRLLHNIAQSAGERGECISDPQDVLYKPAVWPHYR